LKSNSIQIKIMSLIIIALLIIVFISLFFSINSQKNHLLKQEEKNLSKNTSMLNAMIREIMLKGQNDIAFNLMQNLKKIEDFKELSIYNPNGKISFTNEKKTFSNNPVFLEVIKTNKPIDIENKETKEMEYFFPIQNEKECWQCHSDKDVIRGVAYFKVSIAGLYKNINEGRLILFFIFVLIGVIFAVIVIIFLHKIIINPLFSIGSAFKKAGEGDFDIKVSIRSKDELGDLASSFNNFTNNIKQIIIKIKNISENNKTLGNNLNVIASDTSSSTEEISAIIMTSKENIYMLNRKINETVDSIKNISLSIEKIANLIDNQSSAVTQSSSSIEQIANSIENITKVVEDKKRLSDSLSNTAKDGIEKMAESVEAIEKISKSTNNMLEMIGVINNIADQTDLLAMNAAIEAAHAGDAGKGFAVVADEIRKLAEITQENANSIGNALKKAVEDIHRASKLNNNAGESFDNLVLGIQNILNFMNEIMGNMKELSYGSKEIVRAINSLLEMTEHIKINSNQINESSKHINENITQVSDFSYQSSNGMEEVSKGAIQISKSMLTLAELGKENADSIVLLDKELKKFKT